MSSKPAWWPTAESKTHADAGCAHPDQCRVAPCGARYGNNPDRCRRPEDHKPPHSNRYGTTWDDPTR